MEILGWIKAIVDVLSKVRSALKKGEPEKRSNIAKRLAKLHRTVSQIVGNGRHILRSMAKTQGFGSIKGVNLSATLFDPPYTEMDLVCSLPTRDELESIVDAFAVQEQLLRSVLDELRSDAFRNLGILFDELPALQVSVIEKFGTVTLLLSNLREPREVAHKSLADAQGHLAKQGFDLTPNHDERSLMGDSWISCFRPRECTDYSRYLLIYSRRELSEGMTRLDALEAANNEFRHFLKETFKVVDLM